MKRRTIQWAVPLGFVAAIGCSSGGGSVPAEQAGPATTAPAPAPQPASTAAAPVAATFSAAQSGRGRSVFSGVCSACHSTGDFRGNSFVYSWRQRTAWHLYRQVVETMPEDAPGSLSDQEYVDVVAYILELNGHKAGAGELTGTEVSLSTIPVDPSEIGEDVSEGAAWFDQ